MTTGLPSSAPTRILLLRHAMTAAPDRFHGAESDIGLGPEGHRQALTAAEALARLRPHAVYSSGMRRARETAEPIAQRCGLAPGIIAELHERRMGSMSNATIAEVRAEVDQFIQRWGAGDIDAAHPGAESYRELRDRVVPPFQALAERHRGETIITVLHGVVIRVLITSLVESFSPADYHRIAIRHVAVNDLRYNDQGWRIAGMDRDAGALVFP
ncbi:histidine phosphatase family protein [Tautonia marina]|uniref:histidine phosphatase family protein n=1 Tax=Tautonia marina TaxID=2653855 RepID=UPI0012611461|nr:histidine phosphatase family protein [Tautonia marina]